MKTYPSLGSNVLNQTETKPIVFRTGQILYGKVETIDLFGNAHVQIGNQTIRAKIEAPLDVMKPYWFFVANNDGKVNLKLMANVPNEESLLQLFQLPSNRNIKSILFSLQEWGQPLDKDTITLYERWLSKTDNPKMGLETIKYMILNNLPKTEDVYYGLLSVQKAESITSLLENLNVQIHKNHQENEKLGQIIKILLGGQELSYEGISSSLGKTEWQNGHSVKQAIFDIIKLLGLQFEAQRAVKAEPETTTLKQELYQMIQKEQIPIALKSSAEQIINKIVGTQIQYANQEPFFQWTLNIPLPLPNQTIDATIQWAGRKNDAGELDGKHCKIIFDLTMPNLGKTIVYMQVQNRIVTITCKSDDPYAEPLGKSLTGLLKEKLSEQNYQLSSVKFQPLTESGFDKIGNATELLSTIGRLDVKI